MAYHPAAVAAARKAGVTIEVRTHDLDYTSEQQMLTEIIFPATLELQRASMPLQNLLRTSQRSFQFPTSAKRGGGRVRHLGHRAGSGKHSAQSRNVTGVLESLCQTQEATFDTEREAAEGHRVGRYSQAYCEGRQGGVVSVGVKGLILELVAIERGLTNWWRLDAGV